MVSLIKFSCIVIIIASFNDCLLEMREADKNAIVVTTSSITHTVNNLFRTLKYKAKEKTRLNEYTILHKYFEALQDYEIQNKIVSSTKDSDSNKNNETYLVDLLNDILEESGKELNKEINRNDLNVTSHIKAFLYNLQKLKEQLNVVNAYVNINKHVSELLKGTNKNTSIKNESIASKSDEYDIFDENEFWEPSGRRIYKGERTKIRHFPFMASILIFNNFHCAGSIIKSDLIITAASCLQLAWNNRFYRENPAFLSARVGSSFYNGGGEVVPILEVYFHPSYNPKNLKHNICILRLTRKLKFKRRSRRLKKIDFDRHDSNLPLTTYGITVVGWGAKEHSPVIGNPWTNIISYAVLDIYPLRDCQEIYSREYVTMKNFCAGFISRGGGACNRDVGGPGIVDGKLMGIISFGSPVCGMPDSPTVFTKVGYYTDWIENIMEQKVPVSQKRTTHKLINEPDTLSTKFPKSTTFKIPPLNGKTMSTLPISQIDSQLRIVDEDVFKDFLATMINSKEINEYKDLLKDSTGNTVSQIKITEVTKVFHPVTEAIVHPLTLLTDASPEREYSETTNDYTSYNFMDQKYISKDRGESTQSLGDADLKKVIKDIGESENKDSHVNKEKDETMKLYYSSDDKDDEGLSIPDDVFKDLTRTGDDNNAVLPESVLYELLSEVIQEEVENIGVKTSE